jgi:hypothetical protein
VAGYAEVEFRFPEGTLYPCLAVMMEKYGLWYPLSGVALATAPEIELALEMGAEITIRFGVVIPWKSREAVFAEAQAPAAGEGQQDADKGLWLEADGDVFVPAPEMQFPPESTVTWGTGPSSRVDLHPRDAPEVRQEVPPHQFMKLVGNGVWKDRSGLQGQAGAGHGGSEVSRHRSVRISEPAVAALVSASRAVLGEILWKLPAGALAVSATTDGLLVDVETLDLSGTMCQRFQALVDRIAPGTG